MTERKFTKEEGQSLLFLLRADEFYILTRYSYFAFMQYSSFRMVHHTIEYYLKSGLSHFIELKKMKALGHKITSLWKEYKKHVPNTKIDGRFIEHIDRFESIRYPEKNQFVRGAWGLSYQELFNDIMPKIPKDSKDSLACINVDDIDHIVYNIRSSIPSCNEFSINAISEDQERYLYQMNKYFTKKNN